MNSNSKKLLFISLAIVAVLIVGAFYIFISNLKPQKISQSPADKISSPIIPTKTTREELLSSMGNPASDTSIGNMTLLKYSSGSNYYLRDGVVLFFIQESNDSFATYSKSRGEGIAFNAPKDLDVSIWHIYPQRGGGVATVGDLIVKKIFFSPQDEDSFIKTVGAGLDLVKIEGNDTAEEFNFVP